MPFPIFRGRKERAEWLRCQRQFQARGDGRLPGFEMFRIVMRLPGLIIVVDLKQRETGHDVQLPQQREAHQARLTQTGACKVG